MNFSDFRLERHRQWRLVYASRRSLLLGNAVLWTEGQWRCELRVGPAGSARLTVIQGDKIVAAEATFAWLMAKYRAEILRQRVLRGDLKGE